jgi:hypothetical protein
MSAKLETHAEIVKIAHLLQLDPEELEYLAECEADTLSELRLQLIESFYGDENSNLKRFAKVGNLLPTSVIASLTREAVGPILAARVAGFVDPKQAAGVVSRLPVDFVVDIAIAIDPRRVEPVVSRLDPRTIEQLAFELVDRKEYVTMGQFFGFAPEDTLNAVFQYASDEALLRTAFVAESKDRISVALAPQTDDRIASIIKVAIKKDLWPEAIDLFAQLSDEQYVRVINIAAKLPPATLDKLIASTTHHEVWPMMIPAISQMEEPDRAAEALLRGSDEDFRAFTGTVIADKAWADVEDLLTKLDDDRVAEVIKTMIKHDLWPEAMELVSHLSKSQNARVVNLAAKFPAGILDKMIVATTHHRVWPQLIAAISQMENPDRAAEALLRGSVHDHRMFADSLIAQKAWGDIDSLLAKLSDERVAELIRTMIKQDLWPEAMVLVSHLTKEQHSRVVNLAAKFPPGVLDKMVLATTHHQVWPQLVSAIARMDNPNRACDALLRGSNEDIKGFASTVGNAKAWKSVETLMAGLSAGNRAELMKRLGKLKLADAFNQISPMLAA